MLRTTIVGAVILIAAASYGLYFLYSENASLKGELGVLEGTLATETQGRSAAEYESRSLSDALQSERVKATFLKEQADTFAEAVQKLTGRVTTLDKLSKIDPELLVKYSKVYFLNEHYAPIHLVSIPQELVFNSDEEYVNARVLWYLEQLMAAAKQAGADMQVISAYRSFEMQKDLKSRYSVTFGIGANKFSAEQGYSEHQLGTTVDFTTPALGSAFGTFDTTSAFTWLTENAYRFGFVLSYPKGNSYYIYEPWHWRFVGLQLATFLHEQGKPFYDLDQRALDEYLVYFFD